METKKKSRPEREKGGEERERMEINGDRKTKRGKHEKTGRGREMQRARVTETKESKSECDKEKCTHDLWPN